MEAHTNKINLDDLSIRVRLDDVDSPDDAESIRQALDMIPNLEQWLADPDDIAAGELILINDYRDGEGLPKFSTLDLTITHEDGRSWEGKAAWLGRVDMLTQTTRKEHTP